MSEEPKQSSGAAAACQAIGVLIGIAGVLRLCSGYAIRPQEPALGCAVFGFGLLLAGPALLIVGVILRALR